MKMKICKIAVVTSVILLVTWMLMFHAFMYKGPQLAVWIIGAIQFIVKPLLVMLLIGVGCWRLGRFLYSDTLIALILGIGIVSSVAWVLILTHALDYGVVQMFVYGSALLWLYTMVSSIGETESFKEWLGAKIKPIHDLWCNFAAWEWYDKVLLIMAVSWVLRTVFMAFNPSTGFDAVHAHLWQVKNYIQAGGYVYNPFHTNFALAHSMTLVQIIMKQGDVGATFQYATYVITALLLYRIGDWILDRTTGLLTALLFLIQPWAYFTAQSWFADMPMLMFVVAGCYLFLIVELKELYARRMIVVGLMFGFAIATKITCLPLILIMLILSGRNWWRVTLWVAIAAALFLGVNVVMHGNPFYPFRQEWFAWWPLPVTPDTTAYAKPTLPDQWFVWHNFWSNWWYGNNPLVQPGEMTLAGPWGLILLPFVFCVPWRKWSLTMKYIAMITITLFLYWQYVEHRWHPRYMNYVFTVLLVLEGWATTTILKGNCNDSIHQE